jgi:two-component system chemotaxis sensor kinase CheA
MTIDMSQFFKVFFDEAEELLAEKEKLLLNIDVASPDPEDLNAIFRAAHSIKGGASTFGLTDMAEVTHVLESLLDKIRKHEMLLTMEHVDAFLVAKDVLKMQLDGHRSGGHVDLEAVNNVQSLLSSLESNKEQAKNQSPEKNSSIQKENEIQQGYGFFNDESSLKFQEDEQGYGFFDEITSKELKDEKENEQGYGFFDLSENDSIQIVNKNKGNTSSSSDVITKQSIKKEPEKVIANSESSTIRVGIEKVDQIINLIGELVITQAMLTQRTQDLDPIANERLISSVAHLTRNTRDLQQAVMSIRMMPMDYVFSRFPRMVRDLATKLGKKIEFVTYGSSTELDKGLIERIIDPLTHLVRNSVDHGVEMPDVRSANGKKETGKLTLSAVHRGGNIVIEVSDDGGGLNRERILSKAAQNGLPVNDTMSDSDVWQLIFAPGFSTAEIVTDVSGRGVGMDVVKRNITSMGGLVDIRSVAGLGTTITISLPLTLAILDGMSVRVGNEIYILPLGYVMESLQPTKDDIKEVNGKGRVLKIRQEYLPMISLFEYFNIEPLNPDPVNGIIVIVETDGKRAAIVVDDLVGQQQVVVKNIESNYKKIPGVSGATILGDGGVSLILDVSALLRTVQ